MCHKWPIRINEQIIQKSYKKQAIYQKRFKAENGSELRTSRKRPQGWINLFQLFLPFSLFLSLLSCLPLLYSSYGDISPPSLLILPLSLSVCDVAFSAAGPHPHWQCGCYPVLYSPMHCNSATMHTSLLAHTYTPLYGEWNVPEGGGLCWNWLVMWSGSYYLCSIVWVKGGGYYVDENQFI